MRAHSVLGEFLTAIVPAAPGGDAEIWSPRFAERRTREFLENLEAIADATREAGARFLVITQQIKSRTIEPQALRGVTYAEEVERVRASLVAGEIGPGKHGPSLDAGARLARILDTSRILLIHDRLVAEEIRWAKERGIPVADARAALDQRRDLLSSWVHLLPEANEIVAETVADVILSQTSSRAPDDAT
ncbi:MAG: hypothetical protein FJ144_07280 [Deltaproteobacteria bacterium]|nr:hypothetical protein [Deltaproteobacteria bacterium]